MASLGVEQDLLARAILVLEIAIDLMEQGYTTQARALDASDQSIHPTDSKSCKWRLDGALVEATRKAYQACGIECEIDAIDLTVAYSHPWCGVNMSVIASSIDQERACKITRDVAEMLKRNRMRVLTGKASRST